MTTLSISTEVQAILDQLNEAIGQDMFEAITGDYWQRDLTSSLCSSDTHDAILLIDGDYFLLIDCGTYFQIQFITQQKPVYRWHESLLGDIALTEEQKEDLTDEIASELKGFTVIHENRLNLNDWEEPFEDKFSKVLDSCIQYV